MATKPETSTAISRIELKRDLSRLESYATIIGILIGSGIFVVTGEQGAVAGPSVPLAYLVLAPIVLATAVSYSVYLSTPLGNHPGDAYTHISRTTGSYYIGFIALWLKWIAYTGALVILSTSLGRYLKFFYPNMDRWWAQVLPFGQALHQSYSSAPSLGEVVIATLSILFFFCFNMLGVKVYGWLQTLMVTIKIIAIVILVIPGLVAIQWKNFSPVFPYGFWATNTPDGARGFLAALPPLFFSYAGFEALAQTAGETKDARRSLPVILINGILISMIIFCLMSLVAFGVVPYDELSRSGYAMSDTAHRFLPSWGSAVVTIGALMAFSTCLNATLFVPSRILYVFGEDHVLPQSLSRLSGRFRTPWVSLVVNTAIALVLLWSKSFSYVLDVALVAMFVYYALHSLSLVGLPFLKPALYAKARVRLRPAWVVAFGLLSFLSMSYLAVQTITRDISKQETLPAEARGLAVWQLLVVWTLVGSGLYALARWEGRRSGFDYQGQLVKDWADDEADVKASAGP